ncbi:MAG: hypothetical protein PUD72_07435 [Oscillospiraceae bacterium]|nr:hypothetical protein [Oscillospiraceae bacterium]
MNFALPIIAFILFFIAIIVFQILAFKTERVLFWVLSFVSGALGGVFTLLTTSYYVAVINRLEAEVSQMVTGAAEQLKSVEFFSVICLGIAFVFFGSILITGLLLVIKKVLENR